MEGASPSGLAAASPAPSCGSKRGGQPDRDRLRLRQVGCTVARSLRDPGGLHHAAKALRAATHLDPGYAPAWNELANVFADSGHPDVEEAMPLYDLVLALDSSQARCAAKVNGSTKTSLAQKPNEPPVSNSHGHQREVSRPPMGLPMTADTRNGSSFSGVDTPAKSRPRVLVYHQAGEMAPCGNRMS